MLYNKQILVNMIRCPDGTILESRNTHDYQTHTQEDGREFMVDGGLEYLRRSGVGYEELSLCYGDDYGSLRECFTWGARGINGDQPLHYIKLKDITDSHLEALIDYTKGYSIKEINMLFIDEREFRVREGE